MIRKKYTCLMFGEGKNDKDFIYVLSELVKFKYFTQNWRFTFGNAHGGSAADILKLCKKEKTGAEDLILCFIDLDDLKNDYKKDWEKRKKKLEDDASTCGIEIVWFLDKLEEELRRVLGREYRDKQVNRIAKQNTEKFINSELWKRILRHIRGQEDKLNNLVQKK